MAVQLPQEDAKWKKEVEARLKQNHTDLQRLWQRVGQTPYQAGGQNALTTNNGGIQSAGGSGVGP
jgi:hypothetical protein